MNRRAGARFALALGAMNGAVLLSNCHRAQVDLSPFLQSNTASGNGGEAGAPVVVEHPLALDGLPWLGSSCRSNIDCGGEGLRCQTAMQSFSLSLGAPPNGLCTRDCEDDDDCRAYDARARCGTLAEAALSGDLPATMAPRICLLGCMLGGATGDAKCRARPELACRPFAGIGDAAGCDSDDACAEGSFCFRDFCRAAACGPRCNSDQDCSAGRHCNPQNGLCDEHPARVPAIGADCADTGKCGDGTCLTVEAPNGDVLKRMCSVTCTLGSLCGGGSGACASPPLDGLVSGDVGYCQQWCNCDADCLHPADHCLPWQDAELAQHFGMRGACEVAGNGAATLSCDGGAGNIP